MMKHELRARRGIKPPRALAPHHEDMSLTTFKETNVGKASAERGAYRRDMKAKKAWADAAPIRDAARAKYLKMLHKSRSCNNFSGTFSETHQLQDKNFSRIVGTSLAKFPIGTKFA